MGSFLFHMLIVKQAAQKTSSNAHTIPTSHILPDFPYNFDELDIRLMTWITTYWGESTTQLIDRQSFNWFHTSCEVLQISHTPWKSNKESFLSGRRAELFFLDLGYPWIMAVYMVLGQCRVWFVDLLTEQFLYGFRIEMSRWMLLT